MKMPKYKTIPVVGENHWAYTNLLKENGETIFSGEHAENKGFDGGDLYNIFHEEMSPLVARITELEAELEEAKAFEKESQQ